MPIVSVIVPVYNVEKYIRKCLDSLVNQTLKDIEILVINDGSPDNSQRIIDEYVSKYSFVKSFCKQNGGLADARNFGLKHATGKYVGFIDSDDSVELNMYEKLVAKAEEQQAELVVCDLQYVWEDGSKKSMRMAGLNQIEGKTERQSLFTSPLFAWNKLYRRDFFMSTGLEYSVGKWYEDIPVTVPLFAEAKRIAYVPEVMIHYLQRGTSIMGSGYDKRMFHIFDQMKFIYDYYQEHDLLEKYREEIEYLFIEHLMLYGAFRFLRTSHYRELCHESFKMMKSYFPNYRKNSFLKRFSLKNRLFIMTLSPLTLNGWKWILERRG